MKNRLLFAALLIATSCRTKKSPEQPPSPPAYEVPGFELLHALIGIWEGPVVSTTMIGDFPTWKVDFRPIAPSQISARNELDSANNIHLSFFVAQYEGRHTLCLRNGGRDYLLLLRFPTSKPPAQALLSHPAEGLELLPAGVWRKYLD